MRRISCLTAFLLTTLFCTQLPAVGQDAAQWLVKEKLIGKDDLASKDISGIACSSFSAFPRSCLVIDDNIQSAQAVTLTNGVLEAGGMIRLIDNEYKGKLLELDGEGVAYSEGTFYVIGSHGHPRDRDHKLDPVKDRERIDARIAAASQIARVKVGTDRSLSLQHPALSLRAVIASVPELAASAGRRLEDNGLTIEGIAVKGDRLLAGFRGPTLPTGRAAILSVSLNGLLNNTGADPKLFKIPLGEGQGVRDIVPYKDHFLVLGGPTADGSGRYTIDWWDGASDDGVRELLALTNVAGAGNTRKAEALLPLDGDDTKVRVLILFDNETEGAPMAVTVSLH
jgi:hypothetical protein